jgi:DNA primase
MKDPIKLKELIIERLNLAEVMLSYKVSFMYDPRLATEVQYKCPFHGQDNKPSARLYNNTKSCFCWVCRKAWDVVSFIMDKENLSFRNTLNYIIGRYKIDTSSIPDTPTTDIKKIKYSEKNVVLKNLTEHILDLKRKIPFEKYRALCTAYFMVKLSKEDALEQTKTIEGKIKWLKASIQ